MSLGGGVRWLDASAPVRAGVRGSDRNRRESTYQLTRWSNSNLG